MTDILETEIAEKTCYELTLLGSSEDYSAVENILKEEGFEVVQVNAGQKIKLAYPIKKQSQAFLAILKFCGSREVQRISSRLKIDPTVLRFEIQRARVDNVKTIKVKEKENVPSRSFRKLPATKPPKFSESLTNEDLQQTIEKILSE
jgi:ribosomal protein S6